MGGGSQASIMDGKEDSQGMTMALREGFTCTCNHGKRRFQH